MLPLSTLAVLAADAAVAVVGPDSPITISVLIAICTVVASGVSTYVITAHKAGDALKLAGDAQLKIEALGKVVTANKEEAAGDALKLAGDAQTRIEALGKVVTANKEEAREALGHTNERVATAAASIDGVQKRLDRVDNTLEKLSDKLDRIYDAVVVRKNG